VFFCFFLLTFFPFFYCFVFYLAVIDEAEGEVLATEVERGYKHWSLHAKTTPRGLTIPKSNVPVDRCDEHDALVTVMKSDLVNMKEVCLCFWS
jgi:hypothetical protein